MVDRRTLDSPVADWSAPDGAPALVRVDALRKFTEVVSRLGGDPPALLAEVNVDPAILENRHAVVPYRSLVQVLERAAAVLGCPDFGMHLAAAQEGLKVLGPLEFALRHSGTLREALAYGAAHRQVYGTASQMRLEETRREGASFLHFEILLPRLGPHRQAVERALLLAQHIAVSLTGGGVRAREAWFTHDPLSPLATYRDYFEADVRFGQKTNGLWFAERDLDTPLPNVDPQIYVLATTFIEDRFPSTDAALSTRIHGIVERLLLEGECTHGAVASMLGMHPRTLQRRLKAEGTSFEAIKDRVRRDLALRHLTQSTVPLMQVARLLGYSETSALSRSCYRWFAASPRQLRGEALAGPDDERP